MKGIRMATLKNILSMTAVLMLIFFVSICSAQDKNTKKSSNPVVIIQTTMGNITVELFKDKAPRSVENFLGYVKSGFYSGTIFHRVMKNFMIQGGGLTEDLNPRSGVRAPIENESSNGLQNNIGTIAMARTNEMNSATSQFFINTRDNGGAPDFAYTVFGKVIGGMDVVTKIEGSGTYNTLNYQNVPRKPITIKAVKLKAE
jgi:peptidyl-prolyl cis-trans isomerase A (cyclophilin A)